MTALAASQPSDDALSAYIEVWDAASPAVKNRPARLRGALTAALGVAETELRAQIAYRIRAKLVCCDIYEKTAETSRPRVGEGPHAICFWGEAAARIAEGSTGE